jgi:ABC-type glycerol-3-phosphate transport system permease component
LVGGLAVFILLTFLMPLGYMFSTGLKSKEQMSDPNAPVLWPFSQQTFTYNGEELPVYQVPIDNRTENLAAVNRTRTATTFIDPADPEAASSSGRATGARWSRPTSPMLSGATSRKPGTNSTSRCSSATR